ncbi:phosphoribosylamine--glycine ligase [Spirosoma rhododendri]|uniref:Phosphoribosylamine--glycine ligase n=1 Tax=Spirosoma rhododendri TaxID=2728024 RepID=A0A7L5DP71_9BACT|nr:phosphoribosylamine--glycine ligase [Spirosoma rhododendri]QJD78298.1 phosphoribosylamine--glycine ligase [Spirosoma rhododendri]
MNILLLGSGGREHAFAWKLVQSPLCDTLLVAPGNAGTAQVATNVPVSATDFPAIADLIRSRNIDLLIVGPEEPLVKGVVDYIHQQPDLSNLPIVGPDAEGAQLEGSKDFSKQFMARHGIPTAASQTFTADTLTDGLTYLDSHSLPVVLKADGLAAGKGVIIAETVAEAKQTLTDMLSNGRFGSAGSKVVIEQFLRGIELSVFVLSDGVNYKILPEAKDYKRIGEGDTGPNTGGMGAVSPVVFATKSFLEKVEEKVVKPTLTGLQQDGIQYRGFIFIGLMKVNGEPYVIEYNARMGDPETEVVLPRIQTDFAELMLAAGRGELDTISLQVSPQTAVTTVVVSGGYPDAYETDKIISDLERLEDVTAFHAGTKAQDGQVLTNGGRVLALTAQANSLENAVRKSQEAARRVQFEGKQYRKDIGLDLIRYSD